MKSKKLRKRFRCFTRVYGVFNVILVKIKNWFVSLIYQKKQPDLYHIKIANYFSYLLSNFIFFKFNL